ncbi:MAG: helicase-related protein, partial [Pseudomonadota bacterium]
PVKKQTLFFSATMPPEITRLTKQFLNDPVRIEASRPATTAENIAQHIVRIPSADPGTKRLALRALVGAANVKNGIVFCNRKSEVDVVAKSLRRHGFDASPIHGDLDQSMRTRTLEAFRKGDLKLLVASDVAARGLDIPDVSHIFNYDVPHHADDYVHRIGRTGRAGKSGDAFMLVTPADGRSLDKVLKLIGLAPDEVRLEVDWGLAKADTRARGERGRRAERSPRDARDGRGRGRGRPASETSVASMSPLTPTATQVPAPDAARPETALSSRPERSAESRGRRDRRGRKPREAMAESPAPTATPATDDRRRGERPARAREDADRGVVGFGSDLPAFLARPPAAPGPSEG